MSIIQPDGKREPRRPSLKGSLMQDVTRGVERSRAWPRSRGKKQAPHTEEQKEFFRQTQWAYKFQDPRCIKLLDEATAGTPLLPRDIFLMMTSGRLLETQDELGRWLLPTAATQEVSNSLDALGSTEGQIIRRGADRWEAVEGGLGAEWTLHYSQPVVGTPFQVIVNDIPFCSEILVMMYRVEATVASNRFIRLGTNGGATVYATTGDYAQLEANGQLNSVSTAARIASSTTTPITLIATIQNPYLPGMPKWVKSVSGVDDQIFLADWDVPIDTVVFDTDGSGRLENGRCLVAYR